MKAAVARTDLFATPIWTVDLLDFADRLPALVAAAERVLDQHPADTTDLFRQSAAVLQDDPEPAWVDLFRVLAATMESIVADELPLAYGIDRAYLRSWVLRIDDADQFAHTGSALEILHAHLPAVLSSVLYLQVPDALADAPFGGTTFRDPNSVHTRSQGRADVHVAPAPLRLVIFPSYLEHCPEAPPPGLVLDRPRIVVATDLRVAPS